MAPQIRVGMIGLSASAATSWASTAHLPYLQSTFGKSKFEILALCNSSVERAKEAVKAFGLPANTKTYGDPAELAADPDIDLVVCNVRVDKHYETIRPSIAAGKDVFCEWPLASNLIQVRDLVNLAREKGVKTMIGTQGRVAPVVVKVRETLEQGRIGKVLSSEVRAAGGGQDRHSFSDFIDYFTKLSVGGNIVTIGFAHLLDSVQFAIGEFQDIKTALQLQRPDIPIVDSKTKTIKKVVKSDVPDLVVATGTLRASAITQEGATLYVRFRRGQPFPGEAPLVWTINGEKGEIRLTSLDGAAIQANAYARPVRIELHDYATDKISRIEWDWAEWQKDLAGSSRNTGTMYERFAAGESYPTFEDALKLHEELAEIMADWTPPIHEGP